MNESRKIFETKFPVPAHWIHYCSARNKYHCPFASDSKANEYQAMWIVWQEQQKKIDLLIHQVSISEFKDELGHSLKNNLAYVGLLK